MTVPTLDAVTTVNVPLLDLRAQYTSIRNEIRTALEDVIESQQFILGPEVEALEHEIAAYSQCQHAIGVSSGTDALLVALMAIGIEPGDEVITTPYSFFATGGCISRLGARPVFVDIEPQTYNIDPAKLIAAITSRTRAILPVHLFGQMAEMDPILDVARQYGLVVIEDAAQAIGAEYHGRRAGSLGNMGCFSFFPSKNLGGFGDGGMLVTNDPTLADRVRLFRNHGAHPKYHHQLIGGNFRLDALQAAVLRVKLKYLDSWTAARQANATFYCEQFKQAGLSYETQGKARIAHNRVVDMPTEAPDRRHIYNQFVVRCNFRDELAATLKASGIGTEIYYPVPLHVQACFHELGYLPGDMPASERAAAQSLAIPIYPELTNQQQMSVVHAIARFVYEQ